MQPLFGSFIYGEFAYSRACTKKFSKMAVTFSLIAFLLAKIAKTARFLKERNTKSCKIIL